MVLTGAGMSTESGIPDFRSAQGMWADVDPMEVASIDAFRRDPVRVWQWYGPRIHGLLAAEPNAGHRALAELERAGHVQAVVTQNIDTLHTRAGSADVVEVHGSISRFECLGCGAAVTLDDVLAQLREREAPVCPLCAAILKPGVVMFGELLPVDAFLRAEHLAQEAGVLVAVGSSLQVWPVAGLPAETLAGGRGPRDRQRRADRVRRRRGPDRARPCSRGARRRGANPDRRRFRRRAGGGIMRPCRVPRWS